MLTPNIHFNKEIEQTVIGCLLLERDAIEKLYNLIKPEMFFTAHTRLIAGVIYEMWDKGYPIDLVTVTDRLYQNSVFTIDDKNTGHYLTSLCDPICTNANLIYYAIRLREMFAKRELGKLSSFSEDADPFEHAAFVERTIKGILEIKNTDDWKDLSFVGVELTEHIEQAKNGALKFKTTGIKELDNTNGGFRNGNLIVVAARPSVGKSAYMGKIVLMNAHMGYSVGVIPLEMSNKDVMSRMASHESGVPHWKIDRAEFDDEKQRDYVFQTISDMASYKIWMADDTDVNVTDISIKASRLQKKHGLDLLVIDYLQLVKTDKGKNKNREQEVAELTRGLKLLAMKLDIPIILLAQLNRESTKRSDKKPNLSDLRESGAIEQDADVVILLHRDDMSGIMQDEHGNSTDGQADILAVKWRNGACVSLKIGFDKQKMKFYEFDNHTSQGYTQPFNFND